MEASAVWSLLDGATWWPAGAVGLVAATAVGAVAVAAALLLLAARRRAAPLPSFEEDSTLDDDEATGFRSSRFTARVCPACSRPMLLEGDGRWRCAGHPVCR